MRLPLRLALTSSTRLALLLGLLHVFALASLAPLHLPAWVLLAAGAATLASAAVTIRRFALLAARPSVCELVLRDDGTVEATDRSGRVFAAAVSPQSAVFPWLAVILLSRPGSRGLLGLAILADSVQPEEWRLLRTWLRWKAASIKV
jgi:hypothetical protein